jgi:hypothetical protein
MYANHTKQKPPRSTRNVTSWIAVAPMRLVVVAVAPDCVPAWAKTLATSPIDNMNTPSDHSAGTFPRQNQLFPEVRRLLRR